MLKIKKTTKQAFEWFDLDYLSIRLVFVLLNIYSWFVCLHANVRMVKIHVTYRYIITLIQGFVKLVGNIQVQCSLTYRFSGLQLFLIVHHCVLSIKHIKVQAVYELHCSHTRRYGVTIFQIYMCSKSFRYINFY